MALFDVADCEPLRIEQIATQGFLKPINEGDEASLCLPLEDAVYSIFLNGDWPYHSLPVSKLSERKGLFVPNVSIRVDMDSMVFDDEKVVGAVVRSPGVYGIRTNRKPQSGFTERVIVPINGVIPKFAPDAVRVAFTKWEIGKQIGDDWFQLWAVDVGPTQ